MFLSTLLSALPLLNPALPVQEPVKKSSNCTCSKQEPVAQTNTCKTGQKAVFAKVSVNRGKATQQIHGKTAKTTSDKGNKTKAQRSLRKTLEVSANGGNDRGVWKLAKVETVNPDQVVTWGVHEEDSSIARLGSVGRTTGNRVIWGHHDDNSAMSELGNATRGNVITWGQHDATPGFNRLSQVTKNPTATKNTNKTATQQKKAKKNKGQKQTRKNRKR